MSNASRAGAAALISAPIVVIAGALVTTTLSDDAADQVAAFADHHGSMVTGAVLQGISIVLLIAGAAWLASAVFPHARALGLAGGTLAVLGSLPVVYDDGVHAAIGSVAANEQAVHQILSSAAVTAVEPISLLGDIGLALLGIAAAKAGAPRWTAGAIIVGAFAEGAGFATGTKPLVAVAFALLLAAFVAVVRGIAVPDAPTVRSTQFA